jgi:hypothetical protein
MTNDEIIMDALEYLAAGGGIDQLVLTVARRCAISTDTARDLVDVALRENFICVHSDGTVIRS